jgi:hypothetical protein
MGWYVSQIHNPLLGDKVWLRHWVVVPARQHMVAWRASTTTLWQRCLYPPGQGLWIARTALECGHFPKETVGAPEQEIVKKTMLFILSLTFAPPPIPPWAKMMAVFFLGSYDFVALCCETIRQKKTSVVFFNCSCTATKIPFMYSQKKELRGLSPNFHTQVSMSDLYIPRISPHIFLQQNRQTDCGNI